MGDSERERLARMEAKMDHLIQALEKFVLSQAGHNKSFYEVRDNVIKLQTAQKSTWKVISVTAMVSSAMATAGAWIWEHLPRH